jgi:hypothetical protein
MVDRRFFPSWTSELPIFFAEIVFVIFSSKLTLFVRATAAGSNTDTANGATAADAINAPLAKEAATGGNVAGDPSSTPV